MTEIDDKNLNRWNNLYMRWLVCAKEIKNDNSLSDDINISKIIDITGKIQDVGLVLIKTDTQGNTANWP
jgi:hypothetical protein